MTPQQQPAGNGDQQGAQANLQLQVQELQQQFSQVNTRIQEVQQKAMQVEKVQQEQEKFNETINKVVAEKNPEAEGLIEKRQALFDKIVNNPELQKPVEERGEALQKDIQEYQTLEQQVAPLIQQALSEPVVAESRTQLEEVLMDEMTKIDPETPQLFAMRDQLVDRYQQLMQSMQ